MRSVCRRFLHLENPYIRTSGGHLQPRIQREECSAVTLSTVKHVRIVGIDPKSVSQSKRSRHVDIYQLHPFELRIRCFRHFYFVYRFEKNAATSFA